MTALLFIICCLFIYLGVAKHFRPNGQKISLILFKMTFFLTPEKHDKM